MYYIFYAFGISIFSPIFFFKSYFNKIAIIIYAYPIWILFGLHTGLSPTRIIGDFGISIYWKYIGVAFYAALVSFLLFILSIWKIRKDHVFYSRLPLNSNLQYFFIIIFIAFLFIAYPKAMFIGEERFGSFGSVVILIYAIIFLINKKKPTLLFWITYLLVIFIFVRGERVDFILMLIFPFLTTEKIKISRFLFLFFIVFLIGSYSGVSRLGTELSFSDFVDIIGYSFANYGTAVDVVHVYISSIGYYYDFGSSLKPIFNIVLSFIPGSAYGGAVSEYNYSILLRDYVNNLGGGIFYSAGGISFGPVGIVLAGLLYGLLYRYLFINAEKYAVLFITFWLMQFRIQWYGLTYFSNVLIMAVFITIFVRLCVKNKVFLKSN